MLSKDNIITTLILLSHIFKYLYEILSKSNPLQLSKQGVVINKYSAL